MSGPAPQEEREILAAIAELARQHLAVAVEVGPAARLVEDLALDSVTLVALAVQVENHFLVKIAPEEEAEIRTVGDLVAVVRRKLADRRTVQP